jgi:hypothetical protein
MPQDPIIGLLRLRALWRWNYMHDRSGLLLIRRLPEGHSYVQFFADGRVRSLDAGRSGEEALYGDPRQN